MCRGRKCDKVLYGISHIRKSADSLLVPRLRKSLVTPNVQYREIEQTLANNESRHLMKPKEMMVLKADEPWLRATLDNGAVVRFRPIVKSGFQMFNDDGTPTENNMGQHLYGLNIELVSQLEIEPPKEANSILINKSEVN